MTENSILFRKKRDTGVVISDSFGFLKQEYKLIAKLLFVYVLPFVILYAIVQVDVQMKIVSNIDLSDQENLLANIGPIYSNLFFSSLFAIFVQSLMAGAYYSYIETYIEKGKGNFSLSEVTPKLFSNSLIALGAGLLAYILIILGTFLCIVPGLYFANTFSLVVVIAIFEKKGVNNSFSRSWNLVNKQWWNTFILNLLGVVIVWLVGFAVTLPTTIAGLGNTFFNVSETATVVQPMWYWVIIGLSNVVSSFAWIVPYTFLALQYFNLSETNSGQQPVQ